MRLRQNYSSVIMAIQFPFSGITMPRIKMEIVKSENLKVYFKNDTLFKSYFDPR